MREMPSRLLSWWILHALAFLMKRKMFWKYFLCGAAVSIRAVCSMFDNEGRQVFNGVQLPLEMPFFVCAESRARFIELSFMM